MIGCCLEKVCLRSRSLLNCAGGLGSAVLCRLWIGGTLYCNGTHFASEELAGSAAEEIPLGKTDADEDGDGRDGGRGRS